MSFSRLFNNLKHIKIPIGHHCKSLKERFDDPYYNESQLWNFHIKNHVIQINLMKYDQIHRILGCDALQLLNIKCPYPLLIPMATLLALCLDYGDFALQNHYKCLYRNEDEAVGIAFDSLTVYLIPYDINIFHLNNFENVTRFESNVVSKQ